MAIYFIKKGERLSSFFKDLHFLNFTAEKKNYIDPVFSILTKTQSIKKYDKELQCDIYFFKLKVQKFTLSQLSVGYVSRVLNLSTHYFLTRVFQPQIKITPCSLSPFYNCSTQIELA